MRLPSIPILFLVLVWFANALSADAQTRETDGLEVLYNFRTTSGDTVTDRAGDLDLKIANPKAVRRGAGFLEVLGQTKIFAEQPARKLSAAVKKSNGISIEAWVKPANTSQEGPARIVTLSKDSQLRNFTLGQEKDQAVVRLRTTQRTDNGMPGLEARANSLKTELTHLVFTLQPEDGRSRIFVNGEVVADGNMGKDLSNWDESMRFGLADEWSGDRLWKGTYYLVAVYSRELQPEEVTQHFKAGIDAKVEIPPPPPSSPESPNTVTAKPAAILGGPRVHQGLQVFYDFTAAKGARVFDRSGHANPMNLRIEHPDRVRWNEGSLTVTGKTRIRSAGPAARVTEAIRASGESSIEAWITPANTTQEGPARIVTISRNSQNRNVTLGQEKNAFDVRFTTTSTSSNGEPSTRLGGLDTRLTHLVFTTNRKGEAILYRDGKEAVRKTIGGAPSNWNAKDAFALANELSKDDRSWLGTYHLVALYDRDLTPADVRQNFEAGPDASVELTEADSARLFDRHVGAIFANHCLECHDAVNSKGELDMSTAVALTRGGSEGASIVPGDSAASYLWEQIESDDMPHKRDPLSALQKRQVKQWIDAGAVWTVPEIDPAVYVHGEDAGQIFVQRLTRPEYIATVRSVTGVEIEEAALRLLPPDLRADGFRNTAYNLAVDLKHVEAFARLAETIVERMDTAAFAKGFTDCTDTGEDCVGVLISNMGAWLLRGPLEPEEVIMYRNVADAVRQQGGDFAETARYLLEAMLQSPRFVYRMEDQDGAIDAYALASRMSYIVWGAPPDETLYARAATRTLRADIPAQLERMLKDERAVARSVQFLDEWLNLTAVANRRPDAAHFPDWEPALAKDMRAETQAFFREVAWRQNRPLSELFNADVTFLTPRLARHYGLQTGRSAPSSAGLSRVDLRAEPSRGGLLTHGSILAQGGDEASMVSRGLFVLHDVLRGVVKDPPPCVDTTPVPSKPGLTQRAIAEQRVANQACGGCHKRFEPLAFGLEMYDGVGRFTPKDRHGNALRQDGEILFPGKAKPMRFQSTAELADLLAEGERVKLSFTWKVTQFALGRPLVASDAPELAKIHAASQKAGGTYHALVSAIVLSDLVSK